MAGGSGFNVNVPEPTTVQLEGNKTDVYERQQARREKDRRMQSLSDLAGRLLEGKEQTDSVSGPDGSIRQSADTYERITEQLETFYETPQETAGGLEQKVDELNRRLEDKQLTVELTPAAKDFIIDSAYDSVYGARPIKRFIQSRVETLIAKAIIRGSYAEGATLTVDYDGNALTLR